MKLYFPVPSAQVAAVKRDGLRVLSQRPVLHGCTKPGADEKALKWVEVEVVNAAGHETMLMDADYSEGRQWFAFEPSFFG